MLITGPCSAESEDQMRETARQIQEASLPLSYFRAGIWKPRTRPGGFEGVGAPGLKWMQNIREEFGFKLCTEVATTAHVELALEAGIDLLWIGARSTANPFTVQEIAEALAGVKIPIFVKNPTNTDVALWAGAIERLSAKNIQNLGAIHRGFSNYKSTQYRNPPHWDLMVDFRELFPELPILIDPSHITGKREEIGKLLKLGSGMLYDGIMAETHCNPDKAWSDAAQQLLPKGLKTILDQLPNPEITLEEFPVEIQKLRALISELDGLLIANLSKRMEYSNQIGKLKQEKNIAIFQPDRWREIKAELSEKSKRFGLSYEFSLQIFKKIHEESIRCQSEVEINPEG